MKNHQWNNCRNQCNDRRATHDCKVTPEVCSQIRSVGRERQRTKNFFRIVRVHDWHGHNEFSISRKQDVLPGVVCSLRRSVATFFYLRPKGCEYVALIITQTGMFDGIMGFQRRQQFGRSNRILKRKNTSTVKRQRFTDAEDLAHFSTSHSAGIIPPQRRTRN